MWSRIASVAQATLVAALPLGFLVAVASQPPVVGDVTRGDCRLEWCKPGGLAADIDAMLDAQLTDLGCDHRQRLAPRVAVRNAKGHDKGIVRVVTFDEAWSGAKSGDVWVVGYCG